MNPCLGCRPPSLSLLPCLVLLFALTAHPTPAEMCTLDVVPAATLLVPYFEVDFISSDGWNTFIAINNASPHPVLAVVALWTDWGYVTGHFHVYLTGYDIQIIDLLEVFADLVPLTAEATLDPSDAISPHGGLFADNPDWDDTDPGVPDLQGFPGCTMDHFGAFSPPLGFGRVIEGHTGRPLSVLDGNCLGAQHGDNVARGFITIDIVSQCTGFLDYADPGFYFCDGGAGIATDDNYLWGDVVYFDQGNQRTYFHPMVHIEAEPFFTGDPATGYTFYGRFTSMSGIPDGRDNREPLGTTWGGRYFDLEFGTTDFIVWRDSTFNSNLNSGAPCGSLADRLACATPGCVGPNWFPLNETQVFVFNEGEDALEICFGSSPAVSPPAPGDPACFPYMTGRYRVGSALSTPFPFGWAFLDLNIPSDASTVVGEDVDYPRGTNGDLAQSYAFALHSSASGLLVGSLPMVELAHACENAVPLLSVNALAIFTDGFESGGASAWSAVSH